ncbi:MAG: hypothetical protein AVDCRST_MAG29-185 [uncultured Nocardioidaceae bacterium]|uniref:Uncharacterized protein n=1 Tax=uncultured Nocardioidaceae bacterium TaxID=253824 RepID=A0A6J4KX89_9ACTN|nr:MAG: hypothetical protein AVDCRST_MAG29-185 [uncultured Nocardioidaceae bacterium]
MTTEINSWLAGRVPDEWFAAAPSAEIDRDEIIIVGALPLPDRAEGATDAEHAAAVAGRVRRFRETTRDQRVAIARELEHAYGRKVAWAVEADGQREVFTALAAPVMTRLRQPERRVLDTLVESGVARSRSDALGWCVRLVAQHSDEWLAELREAMQRVEEVRAQGPAA